VPLEGELHHQPLQRGLLVVAKYQRGGGHTGGAIPVEYHPNTGGSSPCGVLNTRAIPEGGFLVVAQYRRGGILVGLIPVY